MSCDVSDGGGTGRARAAGLLAPGASPVGRPRGRRAAVRSSFINPPRSRITLDRGRRSEQGARTSVLLGSAPRVRHTSAAGACARPRAGEAILPPNILLRPHRGTRKAPHPWYPASPRSAANEPGPSVPRLSDDDESARIGRVAIPRNGDQPPTSAVEPREVTAVFRVTVPCRRSGRARRFGSSVAASRETLAVVHAVGSLHEGHPTARSITATSRARAILSLKHNDGAFAFLSQNHRPERLRRAREVCALLGSSSLTCRCIGSTVATRSEEAE